jgi:D-cysteine desulfhydrase
MMGKEATMITDKLSRVPLAQLPTPLEALPRLRKVLQRDFPSRSVPPLLVKRDDLTGLATGGNKTRKLEYLMADALAQDADVVLTMGAPQSNHCRQTAAAAAKLGLDCTLILGGSAPLLEGGNLLLDQLLDAEIVWCGQEDRQTVLSATCAALEAAGRRPYTIPYGGSNALGATAYVVAFLELMEQLNSFSREADHIVVPSSSGGTQAGLAVGAAQAGFRGQLHGISIDQKAATLQANLAILATDTARLLDMDLEFQAEDFLVHDAYLGEGYGIMGEVEQKAIRVLATSEGLLADPVYTGRALAGLIDLIGQGLFQEHETVVFWHTGGLPALFAYAHLLSTD